MTTDTRDYIQGVGIILMAFAGGAAVATVIITRATTKHLKKMRGYDKEIEKGIMNIFDILEPHLTSISNKEES